jgi:hypothetical protein
MVAELAKRLPEFPGSANHTRCFAHILNLIARSVIQLFDSPVARDIDGAGSDDGQIEALAALAEGIEQEEEEMAVNDTGEDDNTDGWVDEVELLTEEEREELDESLIPIRTVIVKVRVWEPIQCFMVS